MIPIHKHTGPELTHDTHTHATHNRFTHPSAAAQARHGAPLGRILPGPAGWRGGSRLHSPMGCAAREECGRGRLRRRPPGPLRDHRYGGNGIWVRGGGRGGHWHHQQFTCGRDMHQSTYVNTTENMERQKRHTLPTHRPLQAGAAHHKARAPHPQPSPPARRTLAPCKITPPARKINTCTHLHPEP